MQLLPDVKPIPAWRCSAEACEKLQVLQCKMHGLTKSVAVFSENCYKVLQLDGSYFWINSTGGPGEYDPTLGLFGQRAAKPGEPLILVATEQEALRLVTLGFQAVCLAEPKLLEPGALEVLMEQVQTVTTDLRIWGHSGFTQRFRALEAFLQYLQSTGVFNIQTLADTRDKDLRTLKDSHIEDLIDSSPLVSWLPAGVMTGADLLDDLMARPESTKVSSYSTGFEPIDRADGGVRKGEVVTFTAGSGVGKSTIVREIAYHLGVKEGIKVGMIFLEESVDITALCLAAIRFNIPVGQIVGYPKSLTSKQWEDFKTCKEIRGNFVFYKHFGSLDSQELFSKIRYMIEYHQVDFICLDHISIAVSGMSSREGERKDIDILMTELATMAVTFNVGFLLVSHLSIPKGQQDKPHEEGGRVTMSQLRGSGAIKQLSHSIFALERNQQSEVSTKVLLRQLKGRLLGNTGPIGVLEYNRNTGRLRPSGDDPLEFEKQMRSAGRKGKPTGSQSTWQPKSFGELY